MADTSQSDIYFALYRYTPSIPAAVIFTVVFGGLALFHLYRIIRHRAFFFTPFLIGLICMPPSAALRIPTLT